MMPDWHPANWLYIAAVLSGVIYGLVLAGRQPSHWRAIAKTIPVALFAAAVLSADLPLLLVAALSLSALGDWLLAYEGEKNFLAGLVSFLLAHVCYTMFFFAQQDPYWSGTIGFFAGTLLIFAFSLGVFRRLQPALGNMRLPVTVYTGVLSAMAVSALARGPDPVLLAGVALLLASDAVLAFEKFTFAADSPNLRWSAPSVWFSYLFGQALVTAAFLFAAP